jgi:hypothetical protein
MRQTRLCVAQPTDSAEAVAAHATMRPTTSRRCADDIFLGLDLENV